jgi:hypothetical protein
VKKLAAGAGGVSDRASDARERSWLQSSISDCSPGPAASSLRGAPLWAPGIGVPPSFSAGVQAASESARRTMEMSRRMRHPLHEGCQSCATQPVWDALLAYRMLYQALHGTKRGGNDCGARTFRPRHRTHDANHWSAAAKAASTAGHRMFDNWRGDAHGTGDLRCARGGQGARTPHPLPRVRPGSLVAHR